MDERAAEHAGATPRTHADVTRFFDGTELLDRGVAQPPEWCPEADSGPGALPMSCGVGRKPL
ncbi:SAM-dependent methyltransferase [Streptomyces canus]|uniref:SAM-dependent methyltransferase n=1 Tax=Streptomyces canus TaxID=58343 RepID=UPI0036E8709C